LLLKTTLNQTYDLLYWVSLNSALPDYWGMAFGTEFDASAAQKLIFQWQSQDFRGRLKRSRDDVIEHLS